MTPRDDEERQRPAGLDVSGAIAETRQSLSGSNVANRDFAVQLPEREGRRRGSTTVASAEEDERGSIREEVDVHPPSATADAEKADDAPVTWKSLPNKMQLAILTAARLSEPLTQTSLQSYMFYQLKSFNPDLSDATISSQAGALQASFTAAQFLTAMLWGRTADTWGRKYVLLLGLVGTGISCLGFGFSRSFAQAAVFRALGGALNGNVGVMRTMIAEIIQEKKFQSRAFLLLPMCFNIGAIIGPVLGGLLADPVQSYPNVFGPGSKLGGDEGVWWMRHWPYALPNVIMSGFLIMSAWAVILGLEETLASKRDRADWGLILGRFLSRTFCWWRQKKQTYSRVATDEYSSDIQSHPRSSTSESFDLEHSPRSLKSPKPSPLQRLPLRRIWTRNVLFCLLSHGILAFHVSTFNSLWFVFLSTPRFDPAHPDPPDFHQTPPFKFTGGLGMPPRQVGMAMAILGTIGITLQLFVYPNVNHRLGTVNCYRIFLTCFPVAYIMAPFLSLVPGPVLIWFALAGVLLVQVLARTFALPGAIILINNCSPHPSVLGTVHGIAQSVSSFSRTIGPLSGGVLYGLGLHHGIVGAVWWGMACVAVLGCVASRWVYEGSGHEIYLEGEKPPHNERQ